MSANCCNYRIHEFEKENRDFIKNKIVDSFLKNLNNYALYKQVICNPDLENRQKLDIKFKEHLFEIRFLALLSKSLYFKAIDYDQKFTKYLRRHSLTVNDENNDLIPKYNALALENSEYNVSLNRSGEKLEEMFSDENIISAITQLTEVQKKTLTLFYINELKTYEISTLLGISQQAVSKNHRAAIKKLRRVLKVN